MTHPANNIVGVEMLKSVKLLLGDRRQDGPMSSVLLSGLRGPIGLRDERVGDRSHPLKGGKRSGEVVAADVLQRRGRKQFGTGSFA